MVSDMSRRAALNIIKGGLALEEGPQGDEVTMTTTTDRVVTVYSMIDGAPRSILANDFERVMLKRLPDGRPAFWVEGMPGDPPPAVTQGTLKCFLYPEYEDEGRGFDRAFVDSLGLAGRTCNMNNAMAKNRADFTTEFQREAHERSKHRDEHAVLEQGLARRERERERFDVEQTRAAMLALAGGNAATAQRVVMYACAHCDREFESKQGLLVHTGREHKEE